MSAGRLVRAAAVCVVALACLCPIYGQTESGGAAILVVVADPGGKPVHDATVELRNRETGYSRKVSIRQDGRFSVSVLPVGDYRLDATAASFAKSTVESLKVDVGEPKSVTIRLSVATVREQLTVTADAAAIDADLSASASSIGTKAIDTLPIRGRNFPEFVQLTKAISGAAIRLSSSSRSRRYTNFR